RARIAARPRRFVLGRDGRRHHPLYHRRLPPLAGGGPHRRGTGRAAATRIRSRSPGPQLADLVLPHRHARSGRGGRLGPVPQPPQQTLAALPGLLEESRAAGMRIHAEIRLPDLAAVPDTIGRHALRIIQEALTNARKHATSAPVGLRLEGRPGDGLAIEVRNASPVLATGESKIPGTGTGLLGLAERATLSGGRLEHGLDEHGDFRLRAWLPWPQ